MRLTAKQEKFSQNIANGMTQHAAYIDAYPTSRKWTSEAIDTQASILHANSKVLVRVKGLKAPEYESLEKHQKELIQKALEIALSEKVSTASVSMLGKLIDKLLATKTENKNDTVHNFNIKFDI